MARLAGFVGGAVLTSATIYLATSEMHNRTAYNSHTLREARARLDALRQPATIPPNPRPYIARPSLVETVKDQWNHELEELWRWAVGLDSVRIREGVEETVGNVVRNLRKPS